MDTSIVLSSGTGDILPSQFPYILTLTQRVSDVVIKREGVKVTARAGDVLTVERGFITTIGSDTAGEPGYQTQGNLVFSFDPGDEVYMGIPAEVITDIQDEIDTKVATDNVLLTS